MESWGYISTLSVSNETLRAESARLASINEVLLMENSDLKARRDNPKVVNLSTKKPSAVVI